MERIMLFMFTTLLSLGAISKAEVWSESKWVEATPEEAGMDESKLMQARDYSLKGNGSGCIIRSGRKVMEWGDQEKRYDLKSTTKSIGVTALGLAIKDGKISLGDKAVDYHPSFGIPPESNADTGWLDDITIYHLATQTAGFDKPGGYESLIFEPGTRWAYSDGGPNWLAECITLIYGRDLNDLMFERVFTPIGIEPSDLRWRDNADGTLKNVPKDAYWSWGLYDSFIIVIPSLDIVVVRAGSTIPGERSPSGYRILEPFLRPIAESVQHTQSDSRDANPEINLALGKPFQYAPLPNYGLTAKNNTDSTDLTDGVLSDHPRGHLWFDSKCVGWSYAGRCNLALDLGEVYPIDEVAIRIQGGSPQAGICTPVWMELLVSDDGHLYRLADEYSTFHEGDEGRFGVPEYEGKAWVHRFRFSNLRTRARFVGLRMYMTGLTVADELYVFRGDHDAETCDLDALPATDFSVNGPQMYFHKPYLCFTTNVNTPNPIGLVMPPEAQAEEVTVTMDLPKGTWLIDGGIGGAHASDTVGEEVEDEAFTRYRFVAKAASSSKSWGRIFIGGNWQDKQVGELRYSVRRASGEATPLVSVPLRAIEIQKTPQPEKIVAGFGWYSLEGVKSWPDGLASLRKLGINTVSSFVHWMKDDDKELWSFWEQCSKRGFKRLNIDSTFHRMRKSDEIYCQFEDGKHGSRLCPSYRGTYYQREIQRVADQCARAKPDYLFCDIEIWGWRGPVDAEECTRCMADFEKSGLKNWEEWKLQKGYEMWTDVVEAMRRSVREVDGPEVEFGVYDWRAGKAYQFTWPFDRLYPEYLQSSQVSTYTPLYPYHISLVGDECREDRSNLPETDVIPWITPGDAGTFSGERFRYALLECFANGARGMNFWSNRVWDAELMAAYARVIRSIATVENLIISGKLLDGAETESPGRISGVVSGDEMLVLVADYQGTIPTELGIKLPVKGKCIVTDLDTCEEIGEISNDEWLIIPLHAERIRLLHVKPKKHTQ